MDMLDPATRLAARSSSLLAPLSPQLRDELLRHAVARWVRSGRGIVAEGDAGEGFWFCASGAVRLSRMPASGKRCTLAYLPERSWFGVEGVFAGSHLWDAHAQGDAALLYVAGADLQRLLGTSAEFCRALLLHLAAQAGACADALVDARSLSLDARLARSLLFLLRQHGRPLPEGGPARGIGLPLAQSDLGELIGFSRQHVNASLRRLERRGLIRQTRQGIVVCDPERLRRESDGVELRETAPAGRG